MEFSETLAAICNPLMVDDNEASNDSRDNSSWHSAKNADFGRSTVFLSL